MPKITTQAEPDAESRVAALQPFVGHARIIEYFRRIGPQGLSHAYLFHGPRGVGKTTFARTLAMTLHCERPTSFPTGYCGTCGACIRGLAGSSGDTILVDERFIASLDPKSERKVSGVNVDVAHEIIRLMQMRSYEGGRLVCIVPAFDAITYDYVYNTFLKELEEPDPGKIFLLTSERPDRILPTIRSRSVSVRFDALRDDEIANTLSARYGEDEDRAGALARRSMGSLGDALGQRDPDAASLREIARAWALACLAKPGAMPPMPELGKDDPRGALDEVLRHARLAVRDLMAYALDGEASVLDVDAIPDYKRACAAIGRTAAERAASGLSLFSEATRIAATNVPPATVFGWLQVQMRSTAGP